MTDTIYALSSAPGRSGVALVRVSGPAALEAAKSLSGRKSFNAREAHLAVLKNPAAKETIDRALLLYFKAPHSYTGEDVIEYHVHGGRAVIDSLLAALAAQKNHRMAEPGEFTRQAFENGKLDLTEAEAVADLIDAQTQAQKLQALSQMDGALTRIYAGWTGELTSILAHLEADIEFPDEDLPDKILNETKTAAKKIEIEIAAHLNDNRRGERLRDGIHIAVIGAPNAGKSSLVNALAQRDVAIVSDLAGTTRDVIEAHLDLSGYPVILADTAGLRPAQLNETGHEAIESEGVRRALARAKAADIKILLFDAGEKNFDKETLSLADENALIVLNKIDRAHTPPPVNFYQDVLKISVATGEGLDALLSKLTEKIKFLIGSPETPSLTRARHREALEEARASLARALHAQLPELMAEDLRLGLRALGRVTGRVDVEKILDVIFRDFCIGK